MDSCLFKLLKLFVENGSMTMQEIAVYNDISAKTVNKRIAELNNILGDSAHISVGVERFQLIINNYSKFINLETQFLKGELDLNDPIKQKAYIIDLLIKNQDYVSIDEIADKLTVSRKVINKVLKDIRHELVLYKGKVISKTGKGIKITFATNFDKISALRNLVINYTSKYDWINNLQQFSEYLSKVGIPKQTANRIINNIISLKLFNKYGYTLNNLPKGFYPLWNNKLANDLLEQLQEIFPKVTELELTYILSPLNLYKNKYLDSKKIIAVFQENYQVLVKPFRKKLLQNGLVPKTVYERFKWHLLYSINRRLLYIPLVEVLPQNISDSYPISLELSLELANIINEKYDIELTKNEINYYVIYFEMFLEEVSAITVNQVKIAFIGSIRSSVRKFIQNKLNNVFENLKIDVFNNITAFNQSDKRYLLIFADKPLSINNLQVINVGTAFRPEALAIIMQISVIEQLIKQNKIILSVNHLKAETYYDAVNKMIDQQIKIGELDLNFKHSWMNREKKTNNIFANGIAIPHAIDDSNKERILVSVGIVDNKISFRKNKLELIFLIGIPDSINKDLVNATSRVYDFIGLVSRNEILHKNFMEYDNSKSLVQIAEGI